MDSHKLRPASSTGETLNLDASDGIAITALTAAAVVIGIIAIELTVDSPGDGPSHAIIAYMWSQHPALATHGLWLPGFMYLAGLFTMVVHSALLGPRVFNLGVSALTIAPFYAMVRKLYGSPEALLSTIALVAMPLRIGLGASSLTEASFIFCLVAGLLCLMLSVEGDRVSTGALIAAIVFLILAEMTRYEIWPLLPLLICYLYVRSRNLWATALSLLVLAIFPISWAIGNYQSVGDFFPGIQIAAHPLEDGSPISIAKAITIDARFGGRLIGWLLAVGAIAGLMAESYRAFYRRIGSRILSDRGAYVILVIAIWSMLFAGTLTRGAAMYSRYALLSLTLALPLAAVAYIDVCGRYQHRIAMGIIAIAASLAFAYRAIYPLRAALTSIYITRRSPTDIIAVARWLRTSRYQSDAILSTKLDWDSTYLPLYAPEFSSRFLTISVWIPEEVARGFVKSRRPALLITEHDQADELARVDRVLGRPVEPIMQNPVFSSGPIMVYDISSLTK